MRYYPEEDDSEFEELKAEPWMLEQLKLNPDYCSWGPHEDYMGTKGESWDSQALLDTWGDFSAWGLDELNECVNFYFAVNRASKECDGCGGSGYNPGTRRIADSFYSHSCGPGMVPWNEDITQDEVDALVERGRLSVYGEDGWEKPDPHPTPEEVNECQKGFGAMKGQRFSSHDAINRFILVETRAVRLGVWGLCTTCTGSGYVFTEPAAKLSLTLWWLHPRKGCSRGIEIKEIKKDELVDVYDLLSEAASRNASRFEKVVGL